MSTETAVAPAQHVAAMSLVMPVAKPTELIAYHEEVTRLIQNSLTDGVDYGTIPGTDKPTLLKPGAERLCLAFGAHIEYVLIKSEIDHDREVRWQKKRKRWNNAYKGDRSFSWDVEEGTSQGIYRYIYKARIVRADGRVLGEGEGVCSTMESKYIDRPRDCENTALKMAQKRALVAAVLSAFGLSNRFTQDVEEFVDVEATAKPVGDGSTQKPAKAKGALYTGQGDQEKIIKEILVKRGIAEVHWPAIHDKLRGRPSSDLNAVIAEVTNA